MRAWPITAMHSARKPAKSRVPVRLAADDQPRARWASCSLNTIQGGCKGQPIAGQDGIITVQSAGRRREADRHDWNVVCSVPRRPPPSGLEGASTTMPLFSSPIVLALESDSCKL